AGAGVWDRVRPRLAWIREQVVVHRLVGNRGVGLALLHLARVEGDRRVRLDTLVGKGLLEILVGDRLRHPGRQIRAARTEGQGYDLRAGRDDDRPAGDDGGYLVAPLGAE